MRKLLVILFTVLFLNGCAQTTSLVGPTYTMVKTGNIIQAGTSVATSYGVKHTLGKSPSEFVLSLAKEQSELRECQTSHSTSLSAVFFDTLDNLDCLRNPFSVFR
tara:strand:+ start:300 stop:614 length:315 start_codon:yes stop_codon:yes gene_type:complete